MKISELIIKLAEAKETQGDIEVWAKVDFLGSAMHSHTTRCGPIERFSIAIPIDDDPAVLLEADG